MPILEKKYGLYAQNVVLWDGFSFSLYSISMNTSVSDSPFCCSAGDAEAVVKSVS